MTSMTKHTLIDCFSLRARIVWQDCVNEYPDRGSIPVTALTFINAESIEDNCYHVRKTLCPDKGIHFTSMIF
jgi:type I restriction enzyme S subunit